MENSYMADEEREELLSLMSEENRNFFLDLEQGKATTIPQQIATAWKEYQICEREKEKAIQKVNLLKRKGNALKNKERNARTRRLIERGGLLESLVPCIKDLPTECLTTWLETAVFSQEAKAVLEQVLLENPPEAEEEATGEGEEVIDIWED